MVEPEADLQVTANLSPISPSPVHSAAPLVVSTLQDTVDTIDAMVAAAAGAVEDSIQDPSPIDPALVEADHVVDDDSLNDPYDEEEVLAPSAQDQLQADAAETKDDEYAKTFDSPVGSEGGDAQDVDSHVSASGPTELSSRVSIASEPSNPGHQPQHRFAAATHDTFAISNTLNTAEEQQDTAQPDAAVEAVAPSQAEPVADAQSGADLAAQTKPLDGIESSVVDSQTSALDIQKLVADLTAQSAENKADHDAAASLVHSEPPTSSSLPPSAALPSPSSLPPRPPQPHSTTPSYASQHHPIGVNAGPPAASISQASASKPSPYQIGGAPGTSVDPVVTGPPPAGGPVAASYPTQPPGYSNDPSHDVDSTGPWEQFMADERQYMSEAKWDRFPEGSRIFIGNLSSDKVSKRDVFDLFHKHGRLAQISLKSAYGFVQYHTVDEGQRAMDNLQGTEIRGRRIHLEISRAQEKSKKDRNRSPERGRGRDGGRKSDKHGHSGRDDYRPGRNHSPRRGDYHHPRDDNFGGRDRGYSDSGRNGRGRSRSPVYGRTDRDAYRRRSPSPHSRSRHKPELDLPRRYGADVPDIQIISQPDVDRGFTAWVEGGFKAKGLKVESMVLHPRFPRDQVIQRQAAEGVHAVVDLDLSAQNVARIPVVVFDRSKGNNNVGFDQYINLDPETACEVIFRAKNSSAAAAYGQSYGSTIAFQPSYGTQALGSSGYNDNHQPAAFAAQQPPGTTSSTADLARLMGQVDNATLQRLLSSLPSPAAAAPPVVGGYGQNATGGGPVAPNASVDLQTILGSLRGANAQHAPSQMPYVPGYGGQNAGEGAQRPAASNGDAAAQVQNIMAQLARYRQ